MIELEVRLHFFPEEKSGRYTPIFEGSSAAFLYRDICLNCQLIFEDREFAYPGEECRARIRFLEGMPAELKLHMGLDFALTSPETELASGLVLKVNTFENEFG